MKKIINIISLVTVAAFTLISCQKQVEPHQPGPAEVSGCYGVYFPTQAASGSHVYSPTQDPSIEITLARTNTSGAITVPVKTTVSQDGIFTVGAATFADGQEETTFTVRFDSAEEGTTYSASFEIDDNQYASMYNSSPIALDFSVMRVEMKDFLNPVTKEPAIITLNEGWWGEVHQAKMKYYEVDGVRTCEIYSIEDGGIWGDVVNASLKFNWYTKNNNEAGKNFLEVPKQYFGFDYSDWASKPESAAVNPIYVYDYYWYWIERGYSPEELDGGWLGFAVTEGASDGSGGYPVGYYDGNGGFYFTLRYYIPGLGGFSTDPYEFVAIAEGFTRVDYSLELEADYTVEGITPISVEAGVDVAALRYAVYEGELTATQIANKTEAIISGADPSEIFSDFEYDEEEEKLYAVFGVAPETTGVYTLVGVAYDEGANPQTSAAVTFKHIAGSDTEEYAVDIKVGTEAVPARYGDYDESSSFAFYVTGSDITEAHITYVETSKYVKDVEAYNATVKAGAAVSDDVLAQINQAGGFYGVIDKLTALTSYTVLVWATNGDSDTIATAEWTTSGLPNEFIAVGTYTYASWWEGEDDEQELYLNPNFKDTYVLPNWGGGVDFSFTMDANGTIYIPTFYIGDNHSSYGPVYYVDPYDYYTEAGMEDDPTRAVHSFYDAEANEYNFHFVLAVSAGSFGHFWESYKPAAGESPASAVAAALNKALKSSKLESSAPTKFQVPAQWKSFPREIKPVDVKVSVSYERVKSQDKQNRVPSLKETRK